MESHALKQCNKMESSVLKQCTQPFWTGLKIYRNSTIVPKTSQALIMTQILFIKWFSSAPSSLALSFLKWTFLLLFGSIKFQFVYL